jgi:hypothetical protein
MSGPPFNNPWLRHPRLPPFLKSAEGWVPHHCVYGCRFQTLGMGGPPSITLSALSRDTWSVRVSDALDRALSLEVWFLLIRKPLLLLLLLPLLLPLLMATQARFAESHDGS